MLNFYINNSDSYIEKTNINFNPNNEVETEIIINELSEIPDYLLVMSNETLLENSKIESRWFILETTRTRKDQYRLLLKRDVIYDCLNNLKSAPIFVQKGYLPETSPLIVNSEGMNLNQIKKSEKLLKDNSGCAWAVIYVSKDYAASDISIQTSSEDISQYTSIDDVAYAAGITSANLISLLNFGEVNTNLAYVTKSVRFNLGAYGVNASAFDFSPFISMNFISNSGELDTFSTNSNKGTVPATYDITGSNYDTVAASVLVPAVKNQLITNRATLKSLVSSLSSRSYYLSDKSLEEIRKYAGDTIYYNGKYYTLGIQMVNSSVSTKLLDDELLSGIPSLSNILENAVSGLTNISYAANARINELVANEQTLYITMIEVSGSTTISSGEVKISSSRAQTADAEYDIIAVPLFANRVEWVKYVNNHRVFGHINCIDSIIRRIISEIGIQGSSNVYDIQLLPYCPIDDLIYPEEQHGVINIPSSLQEDIDYNVITGSFTENKNEEIIVNSSDLSFSYDSDLDKTVAATYLLLIPNSATDITHIEVITGDNIPDNYTVTFSLYVGLDGHTYYRYKIDFEFNGDVTGQDINFLCTVKFSWKSVSANAGVIFYCKKANFQRQLNVQLSLNESMKIDSNCDMYRIVSPNYQGCFEFNVAKNGGKVDYFTAYCTYKPYTPTIKVAPNFNFLYGSDFKDARGLICGGDFSLPRSTSAWETFELNNKNYQNIFNREIQHMDFEYSIERRNAIVSGSVAAFSDVLKGGVAGGLVKGVSGAITGGMTAGALSGIGMAIDLDTLSRQYKENKSLAIDKYNYSLGNIKALPNTITKVGSYDIISKIWPTIEYYTCSDEEKEAFKRKIQYESMTVMAIDYISNYIAVDNSLHYFKGELIRVNDIKANYKIVETIYSELLKGVYI